MSTMSLGFQLEVALIVSHITVCLLALLLRLPYI